MEREIAIKRRVDASQRLLGKGATQLGRNTLVQYEWDIVHLSRILIFDSMFRSSTLRLYVQILYSPTLC